MGRFVAFLPTRCSFSLLVFLVLGATAGAQQAQPAVSPYQRLRQPRIDPATGAAVQPPVNSDAPGTGNPATIPPGSATGSEPTASPPGAGARGSAGAAGAAAAAAGSTGATTAGPAAAKPAVSATPTGPKVSYTDVNVDGPYIAITFDDGPHATFTPKLLDLLAKKRVKATFFMVGQCAAEYPEIVKRMTAEGHEVANHSWSHPNLAKMSDEGVREQLQKTQFAIERACGITPKVMRPPYGELSQRQRQWVYRDFGFKVILWDVDPLDWKRPGPGVVTSRIVNGTRGGSIILAHDIHGQTVDAMPATLDALLAKGFKFVTVSELLAMDKGGTRPEPNLNKPKTEGPNAAGKPAPIAASPAPATAATGAGAGSGATAAVASIVSATERKAAPAVAAGAAASPTPVRSNLSGAAASPSPSPAATRVAR